MGDRPRFLKPLIATFGINVVCPLYLRGWIYRLHTRWFQLSVETLDAIHYGSMAVYKVGVIVPNLIPLVALYFSSQT